jgi:hypothetical protein
MNWIELNEIRRRAEVGEMTEKEAGEAVGMIYHLIRFVHEHPELSWVGDEVNRLLDVAFALHRTGAVIPVNDNVQGFLNKMKDKVTP